MDKEKRGADREKFMSYIHSRVTDGGMLRKAERVERNVESPEEISRRISVMQQIHDNEGAAECEGQEAADTARAAGSPSDDSREPEEAGKGAIIPYGDRE